MDEQIQEDGKCVCIPNFVSLELFLWIVDYGEKKDFTIVKINASLELGNPWPRRKRMFPGVEGRGQS